MSPQQAKGAVVDRRTDIFTFGAVLFEMLTGRLAFPGETIAEILAAVLKAEPDWSRLPHETPPGIQRLLRRCLQKDPTRRQQYIADARIEIEESQHAPEQPVREGVASTGPALPLTAAWR